MTSEAILVASAWLAVCVATTTLEVRAPARRAEPQAVPVQVHESGGNDCPEYVDGKCAAVT